MMTVYCALVVGELLQELWNALRGVKYSADDVPVSKGAGLMAYLFLVATMAFPLRFDDTEGTIQAKDSTKANSGLSE